tara:strand:- start:1136 stop:1720 length:585 start_codon:yes stop_codon:yes gene_type:complete
MEIKFTIERVVNASKDVCLWNTWDHEHLFYVHKQFNSARILHENSTCAVLETKIKIPFLPIFMKSIHCLYEIADRNVLVIDTMPLGILARVEMLYKELSEKETMLTNNYNLSVPFYFYPFKGILKYFILKWNKINWEEDMPLKVRRQKAIDLGFRDFRGIVGEERGRKQSVRLPIPRSKDSIINHGCTESIQID